MNRMLTLGALGTAMAMAGTHHGLMIQPSFSFFYGSQKFTNVGSTWKNHSQARLIDSGRAQQIQSWTNPNSGMKALSVSIRDSKITETTVFLSNEGRQPTPAIQYLQVLDQGYLAQPSDKIVVFNNYGNPEDNAAYFPDARVLPPNVEIKLSGQGNFRPNSDHSSFNLSWGDEGMVVSVDWPGRWVAHFHRTGDEIYLQIGPQQRPFTVHPGEEVRAPIVTTMRWTGNWKKAQDAWRKLMKNHRLPKLTKTFPTSSKPLPGA